MADTTRINLYLPAPVAAALAESADLHGITQKAAMIRAIGLAQALDAAQIGGHHVGTARDRAVLDTVLLLPSIHKSAA